MATQETQKNFERKLLCVFVLDTSASMNFTQVVGSQKPIDALNEALQTMYNTVVDDPTTRQRLEIALISFNDDARIDMKPTLVDNCIGIPNLIAKGQTNVVAAMNTAIELVEKRNEELEAQHLRGWIPNIILISDGRPCPNNERDIETLRLRIQQDTMRDEANNTHRKYIFFPVGVGDNADMDFLSKIKGSQEPIKLENCNQFKNFFKFISMSASAYIRGGNTDGDGILNGGWNPDDGFTFNIDF